MTASLFDNDEPTKAATRALLAASLCATIDGDQLLDGLGLGVESIDAEELCPLADAIERVRVAWAGVSEVTRKRLIDPARKRRIATAAGFVDGARLP